MVCILFTGWAGESFPRDRGLGAERFHATVGDVVAYVDFGSACGEEWDAGPNRTWTGVLAWFLPRECDTNVADLKGPVPVTNCRLTIAVADP